MQYFYKEYLKALGAAKFRGGELLSKEMEKGNWKKKLSFRCAFGHEFEASPRLILEGGHWCPEWERKSWNYGKRTKVDLRQVKKARAYMTACWQTGGTAGL